MCFVSGLKGGQAVQRRPTISNERLWHPHFRLPTLQIQKLFMAITMKSMKSLLFLTLELCHWKALVLKSYSCAGVPLSQVARIMRTSGSKPCNLKSVCPPGTYELETCHRDEIGAMPGMSSRLLLSWRPRG